MLQYYLLFDLKWHVKYAWLGNSYYRMYLFSTWEENLLLKPKSSSSNDFIVKDFKSKSGSCSFESLRWCWNIWLFDNSLFKEVCRLVARPLSNWVEEGAATPFNECKVLLLWKFWLDSVPGLIVVSGYKFDVNAKLLIVDDRLLGYLSMNWFYLLIGQNNRFTVMKQNCICHSISDLFLQNLNAKNFISLAGCPGQ